MAGRTPRHRSGDIGHQSTDDPLRRAVLPSRYLDIDILVVDALDGIVEGIRLPREETTENAFVLAPMAEIAPDRVLPGEHASLATLWKRYDKPQKIERIGFCWRGQLLPLAC
ncbi:MAG: 2-amino-4-hydroxy-6-hydroxymethyldihydropteridine diphosphokinase [Gammaproteobacteria bacterium]|nr:2-amino-4-hydroxy-6-hydroxymethyldihydropteridine diphosphokinase [Gammaproteobacteria bacterium]